MDKLLSDSAKTEISDKVMDILRAYHFSNCHCEPYHQNQNPAKWRYRTIKSWTNTVMNRSGAPANCWVLCLIYVRHYPGRFSEFSGFSNINFNTTTHSIATNVISLERTRQAASNGTPMSTLKMQLQGIMTLQTYLKKFRSKMVNLLVHHNLPASSRTCSEKQLLHRYTPGYTCSMS